MTAVYKIAPVALLRVPMNPGTNPVEAANVQQYLGSTLYEFVRLRHRFSSIKPLGSTGWDIPLMRAFTDAGYLGPDDPHERLEALIVRATMGLLARDI